MKTANTNVQNVPGRRACCPECVCTGSGRSASWMEAAWEARAGRPPSSFTAAWALTASPAHGNGCRSSADERGVSFECSLPVTCYLHSCPNSQSLPPPSCAFRRAGSWSCCKSGGPRASEALPGLDLEEHTPQGPPFISFHCMLPHNLAAAWRVSSQTHRTGQQWSNTPAKQGDRPSTIH